MVKPQYVPEAGDIVWMDFSPQAGKEMAGRHPAVVLSRQAYSVATGIALVVPITSKGKGGTFEVLVHGSGRIKGYALANEVKSVDYAPRNMEHAETCPAEALAKIREILVAIIGG